MKSLFIILLFVTTTAHSQFGPIGRGTPNDKVAQIAATDTVIKLDPKLDAGGTTPAGWTALEGHPHTGVRTATDSRGGTTLTASTVDPSNWANIFGLTAQNDNGYSGAATDSTFPNAVRLSGMWNYGHAYTTSADNNFQVSGLDNSKTYTAIFHCSFKQALVAEGTFDVNRMKIKCNGVDYYINASNNINGLITIPNITPSSAIIQYWIGNESASAESSAGIFNAFILIRNNY